MYNGTPSEFAKKNARAESLLCQLAAEFFNRESNGTSLITITDCQLSKDAREAIIFLSVLPIDHAGTALDFAKRKRGELREYIRKHGRFGRLPFLEIELAPVE